ncbi:hypothetical protein D1AOALGA4SA_6249 [Olavius algarvensis Delta 1 endosymbiont]|nr:hypothetical protein D1AOALGA4SA_6249 [Olavius algarvensis Delta 1 endosymbiont]
MTTVRTKWSCFHSSLYVWNEDATPLISVRNFGYDIKEAVKD